LSLLFLCLPHFGGETYCFCPVRHTVCQCNSSETTEQNCGMPGVKSFKRRFSTSQKYFNTYQVSWNSVQYSTVVSEELPWQAASVVNFREILKFKERDVSNNACLRSYIGQKWSSHVLVCHLFTSKTYQHLDSSIFWLDIETDRGILNQGFNFL
jgi:hypothetical protein